MPHFGQVHVSFSVFGTPDETLALVFDILLQKKLCFKSMELSAGKWMELT